ncbi:hypothetical protein LN042_15025 [Kitasatospora sp. RB6PN24]|uniref:hypothetical protein n=1 Tax=Kitasatospora humi TaxID=2893891 RepID=UPI001E2B0D2B|nr:hypothetical protein [Kitasatospora humi]MCC9308387.1 hypothetical protein [Kitasatospora humi]
MNGDEQQPTGPEFVKFRMKCPNCNDQGTRYRVLMRARGRVRHDGRHSIAAGSSYVPQTCSDCGGTGFLQLGSEEWTGCPKRPGADPSAP